MTIKQEMKLCLYSHLLFLFSLTNLVYSLEREMTINVEAGREDCFYQWALKGEVIELEYQVLDGGNLDISFRLSEPNGRVLYTDFKKPENNHRVVVQQDGDYIFCFDNTFSTYNRKTVFFELIVERDGDEWNNNDIGDWDSVKFIPAEEIYDLKVRDIQEVINKVHEQLNKAKHYQLLYKNFEARDRNIAEDNYLRVNRFSFIQVMIMIFVGIVQVIMVRSLFDDSSKVNRALKKLNLGR